ncbi:MAG: hypothetical protein J6X28_00260 [Bacilli bacterium]|nr:hypothetical protein [Bacilli bacterium]
MIQRIEIIINHGAIEETKALILCPENTCQINKNHYKVTEEWIQELLNIIYLWKKEYGSDSKIDSEEFQVVVKAEDGITKFHGKGIFPHNYEMLKELLEDVYVESA